MRRLLVVALLTVASCGDTNGTSVGAEVDDVTSSAGTSPSPATTGGEDASSDVDSTFDEQPGIQGDVAIAGAPPDR